MVDGGGLSLSLPLCLSVWLCLALSGSVSLSLCRSHTGAQVVQEEFSRRQNCANVFALLDTNGDGRVDAQELAHMLLQKDREREAERGRQAETEAREGCWDALRTWPREGITLDELTELLCGG